MSSGALQKHSLMFLTYSGFLFTAGKWSGADKSAPHHGDLCVNWGECWIDYDSHSAPFDLHVYSHMIPAQHIQPCRKQFCLLCLGLLDTALYILFCFFKCMFKVEYIYIMLPYAALFHLQRCVLYTVNFTSYQKYIILEANWVKCSQCACNSLAIVWGVKFTWLFLLEELKGGR